MSEFLAPTTAPADRGVTAGPPLHLPHTDWLHHRLNVAGPSAAIAAFREAAAGAGIIPWALDLDRIEEDAFHLLVSPPAPQRRTLHVAGARVLARRLREAVAHRHDIAVARVGNSKACAFDLHALVPVPDAVLQLGPDDPAALVWLWEHWGTTAALRHVGRDAGTGPDLLPVEQGEVRFHSSFWSADWTPWRAFAQLARRWPALRFDLRPTYGHR